MNSVKLGRPRCYGPRPGGRPLAVSWALAVGARHPHRGILEPASGRKYRKKIIKVGVKWELSAFLLVQGVSLPRPTMTHGGGCRWAWRGAPPDRPGGRGLPCLLACGGRSPNGAREPRRGRQGPAGRRGGGVGLVGSTWEGRGEDPRNTLRGPPTEPAFINGNHICNLTAKLTDRPGLQMATTEPPRGTLLAAQEGKRGTRPAPWLPWPPKPPAARVYPAFGPAAAEAACGEGTPNGGGQGHKGGRPRKGSQGAGRGLPSWAASTRQAPRL